MTTPKATPRPSKLSADNEAEPTREQELQKALTALRAWEHWYNEDSTEFNRDNAREMGLRAIRALAKEGK